MISKWSKCCFSLTQLFSCFIYLNSNIFCSLTDYVYQYSSCIKIFGSLWKYCFFFKVFNVSNNLTLFTNISPTEYAEIHSVLLTLFSEISMLVLFLSCAPFSQPFAFFSFQLVFCKFYLILSFQQLICCHWLEFFFNTVGFFCCF